ncbi:GlxA family transcriptional regulator [Gynuella sunshinyii]|uniref:Transcriptional regulator containing an amidase domain and an AraC-type DNA-binding HTH domain n=1 Tax=Gynuella sunshinyii YC6258 TaxID=1445510 RepID=A0A0C5V7X8_9GAMM|nr:GlxA family transcriptional regulator [Gynuella sunshinyii]AJQ95525.1 transcriptional regulator containing an amidase domain and an AraC-type DNA-binding HTH domain [Gynuella sunshinyii YC6258]
MHTFVIIVPTGGILLEAVGIADILEQANQLKPEESPALLYQSVIVTTQPHRLAHGRAKVSLVADYSLCELEPEQPRDTILVTGRGLNRAEDDNLVEWLQAAAPHAKRVVSVCGGALLLAQAGILDGRKATTHWRLLDTLQSRFPKVIVKRGPIYIEDGPVWTSAGVTSGFDLVLALVEADYGFALARDVAQDLVMYLRRPGGQSQFSRHLANQALQPGPIRELQSWIMEHLTADLSVENLASRVAMSPRNFTRVFTRETGTTPARYVEEARLDAARQFLEQSTMAIEQIAIATGFGNSLNLRRTFERNIQISPTEYRQRFCSRNLA